MLSLIRVRILKFKSFVPFWRWLYFSSSDFECQELIKQRFWQRLWSVYIRWNQRDFHQFSWNPAFSDVIFINEFNLFTPTADFLFLTLKSWFYSCIHPANIADVHFHSLSFTLASPHTTKAKNPILLFLLLKNFIYDLWLVRCSFLTCEETHVTYQNLCSSLQINFFFKFSLE